MFTRRNAWSRTCFVHKMLPNLVSGKPADPCMPGCHNSTKRVRFMVFRCSMRPANISRGLAGRPDLGARDIGMSPPVSIRFVLPPLRVPRSHCEVFCFRSCPTTRSSSANRVPALKLEICPHQAESDFRPAPVQKQQAAVPHAVSERPHTPSPTEASAKLCPCSVPKISRIFNLVQSALPSYQTSTPRVHFAVSECSIRPANPSRGSVGLPCRDT